MRVAVADDRSGTAWAALQLVPAAQLVPAWYLVFMHGWWVRLERVGGGHCGWSPIVVGGSAAHDRADCYDGIVLAALGQRLGYEGDLEAARHPDHLGRGREVPG